MSRKFIVSLVLFFYVVAYSVARTSSSGSVLSPEVAMHLLYDNFDSQTKTATWKDFDFPTVDGEEQNLFVCEVDTESLKVSILQQQEVVESGIEKDYVLTWAAPESWREGSGRQCRVVIGGVVFVRQGDSWKIENSNRYMASAGTYGMPPAKVRFVQVGAAKHGFILETSDLTQGYRGTEAQLVAPVGAAFKEIWSESIYADNSGACGSLENANEAQPCYRAKVNYSFVPRSRSEYFDIRAVSHGKRPEPGGKVTSANWTKMFRFWDGSYHETTSGK